MCATRIAGGKPARKEREWFLIMAGDWIKIDHVTPDKPEVHLIASDLGIEPNSVLGALVRLWIWADQQTITGCAPSVTKSVIDRVACAPGLADSLQKRGWIRLDGTGAEFPNFERHNGNTAKTRALSLKRMRKAR